MSTPIQCSTCRFYQPFSDPKEGRCIFNPPTPVALPYYELEASFPRWEVESAWATVSEDELCGQFRLHDQYAPKFETITCS